MKSKMIYVTVLMLLCLFSGNAFAGKITILHLNGINTSNDQAEFNRQELENKYLAKLKEKYPNDTFEFAKVHNIHYTLMLDLYESFIQLQGEQGGFFNFLSGSIINSSLSGRLLTLLTEIAETTTLNKIYQFAQSRLLAGEKIIVVSHSQGNFYGNELYEKIKTELPTKIKSIKLVSIATPSNYVAGEDSSSYPYLTLECDIIDTVSGNLEWNYELATQKDTHGDVYLHHSLTKEYLGNSVVSDKIYELIKRQINLSQWSESEIGNGDLVVMLNWGSEPDVDLHVYEPDSTHVYFLNLVGNYGYLDLDDTTGYGPEHYYIVENGLKDGTYQVWLHYYYGANPETANLMIVARRSNGTLTSRTYSVDLATSSTSSIPSRHICNVVVSGGNISFLSF